MGTYIAAADVYAVFSQANVDAWADLDADGSPDTDRVTNAIAFAEGYGEDRLRNGKYALPLSFSSTNSQQVWKRILAVFAAWEVYTSRGLRDDANTNKLQLLRDEADAVLDKYASDMMTFDAELAESGPTAPFSAG
jgi:hypothetical protein